MINDYTDEFRCSIQITIQCTVHALARDVTMEPV